MDTAPVIYTLGYYLCCPRDYYKRRVPRRHQSDTLTTFDPLLFCEVYRCAGPGEFKWLMENTGKKEGYYGSILIEGSDGSRRDPLDTDFISTPSPAPAVPSEVLSERLVTAGGPGAGDTSAKQPDGPPIDAPADNVELLLKIKNLLVEPIRVNAVAAQLGVTADEVKREVLKPDSGVELKAAGWLGLLGTV